MEMLQLPGYTEEEKLQIARKYLVSKQMKAHGLRPEEVQVEDEALRTVIQEYTREAGVRNLEREVASLFRKSAREIAEGATGITIGPDKVRSYLGRPRHYAEVAEMVDRPGVVTGLVWTPVGGDIVFIEATAMQGAGARIWPFRRTTSRSMRFTSTCRRERYRRTVPRRESPWRRPSPR